MRTEYKRAAVYRIIRDAGRPMSRAEVAAIAGTNSRAAGKLISILRRDGWVEAHGDLAHRVFVALRDGEPESRRGRNQFSDDNLENGPETKRRILTQHKNPNLFYHSWREGTPGEIPAIPSIADMLGLSSARQ